MQYNHIAQKIGNGLKNAKFDAFLGSTKKVASGQNEGTHGPEALQAESVDMDYQREELYHKQNAVVQLLFTMQRKVFVPNRYYLRGNSAFFCAAAVLAGDDCAPPLLPRRVAALCSEELSALNLMPPDWDLVGLLIIGSRY